MRIDTHGSILGHPVYMTVVIGTCNDTKWVFPRPRSANYLKWSTVYSSSYGNWGKGTSAMDCFFIQNSAQKYDIGLREYNS